MTPDKHTNQELSLDVGNKHQIYVQDWGNAAAKLPIFFIHGGPGNGCDDLDKGKFDPNRQRVIFHDQRGSGKSQPSGLLENNTTDRLISDISTIAQKMDIDKFILVGGSWGSTLSLLYAIANPSKVAGLVIDGIFLATKSENDWLDNGGWKVFFPDVWQDYIAEVPQAYKDKPGEYWSDQAVSNDKQKAKRASYAHIKMELALLKLDDTYLLKSYQDYDAAAGQIELYYLSNGCFIPEGYILNNASKLEVPVRIIQGRYDMVCPPVSAQKLQQTLPNSQLVYTINGHLRQHEAKSIQRIFIEQLSGQST